MTRYLFAALLLMPLALAAAESQRILIPIHFDQAVEGAHGSLWVTEMAVFVPGDTRLHLDGYLTGCNFTCVEDWTYPGTTFYPTLEMGPRNKPHGYFLIAAPFGANPLPKVIVKLRSRDLSRQMDDWGTEIPTVIESEAPVGEFNLLDVPTDPRYRLMVRLYHFGSTEAVQATIRYFATPVSVKSGYPSSVAPDVLLAEETVAMSNTTDAWWVPGYAELTNIVERNPAIASHPRIRVEVESSDEDLKIWGFLTITNNQTQHVTVISP